MYLFRRVMQEVNETKHTAFINVYQTLNPDLNELIKSAKSNVAPGFDVTIRRAFYNPAPNQVLYQGCVFSCRGWYRHKDNLTGNSYFTRMRIFIYNVDNNYSPNVDIKAFEKTPIAGGYVGDNIGEFDHYYNVLSMR